MLKTRKKRPVRDRTATTLPHYFALLTLGDDR
jgi:hypothetical protein